MRYNAIINLNVDYNDSALGIRNALEQTLLNNTTGMTVEIRSTELHEIEQDVIKFKGGRYSINAWLLLLPTYLFKQVQDCKDERLAKSFSSATNLTEAIRLIIGCEDDANGQDFWGKYTHELFDKIEDEYFEKIGQQTYSYFISKLSEPYRTDGLNYLTSKANLNKPCKKDVLGYPCY